MTKTIGTIANGTGLGLQPEASNVERALTGQPMVARSAMPVNAALALTAQTKRRVEEVFAQTAKPTLAQIQYIFEGWGAEEIEKVNAMIREVVNHE